MKHQASANQPNPPSAHNIRAFIAITLSPEIHRGLAQIMDSLKSIMPDAPVRWVKPQNVHLTIKFLGNISFSNQELLTRGLVSESKRHAAFELSVGGLGVFPNFRRPKVIWVGVQAPEELFALHKGVEGEMARLGYAPEPRPFSPHLTLGRVSRNASPRDNEVIASAIRQSQAEFLGALRVVSLELFRSDLKPEGPLYSRLFSARLLDQTVS